MARLPESIEVSIKDIPEVRAALEQAKALEVRHAALVAAAREAAQMLDYLWTAENLNGTPVRETFYDDDPLVSDVPAVLDALRAALDGEPS